MKAFVVVSYASWVATDFEPCIDSSQWKLIRDYGFDVPENLNAYEGVAWWMNAQHAARLQRVGVAKSLTAPGSGWLSSVPESLTGRKIYSSDLLEFLSWPSTYQCWVKPAEAKIDGFEAGWRSVADVWRISSELNIPADSSVQWTESLLDLNHEYRFYVLNGEIQTGSQYLVDGITFYDGADGSKMGEARAFADYATRVLGDNQPAAYTLDVGFDNISQRWILIEGNPAWCSGIYGSNPAKALTVIEHSCHMTLLNEKFKWIPDAYLKGIADRKIALR